MPATTTAANITNNQSRPSPSLKPALYHYDSPLLLPILQPLASPSVTHRHRFHPHQTPHTSCI